MDVPWSNEEKKMTSWPPKNWYHNRKCSVRTSCLPHKGFCKWLGDWSVFCFLPFTFYCQAFSPQLEATETPGTQSANILWLKGLLTDETWSTGSMGDRVIKILHWCFYLPSRLGFRRKAHCTNGRLIQTWEVILVKCLMSTLIHQLRIPAWRSLRETVDIKCLRKGHPAQVPVPLTAFYKTNCADKPACLSHSFTHFSTKQQTPSGDYPLPGWGVLVFHHGTP